MNTQYPELDNIEVSNQIKLIELDNSAYVKCIVLINIDSWRCHGDRPVQPRVQAS